MKLSQNHLLPALLLVCGAVHGTPSGLNNIPTADTIPHRKVAIQAFDLFAPGSDDFWLGFKTGLEFGPAHFEWGLDSHILPEDAGPLYFQAKAAFSPWVDGLLSLGVANVGLTDSDRAGDPFTYAVITHDLKAFRLSVGYGLQDEGNTVLLGIDRTWKVFERNLNLNADLVQIRDESGWMAAAGLKYDITENIVFESWVNFPDEGDASVMLKLNCVFSF